MQTKQHRKAVVALMMSFAMMVAPAFSAAAAEEKKATRSWEEWLEPFLPTENVQEIHGKFQYGSVLYYEGDVITDEVDEKYLKPYVLSNDEYVCYAVVQSDTPLYRINRNDGKIADLHKGDLLLIAMDDENSAATYEEPNTDIVLQARTMYKGKDAYYDSNALKTDEGASVFWRVAVNDPAFAQASEDIQIDLDLDREFWFTDGNDLRIPEGMVFITDKFKSGTEYIPGTRNFSVAWVEVAGRRIDMPAELVDRYLIYHEEAEAK